MGPAETIDNDALPMQAQALRDLLRRYRLDRQFLQNPATRIVSFVDSHDITAFINPDKPKVHKGFGFDAENLEHDGIPSLALKHKSDQLLRKLLFADIQVGLLPSHSEELDDEVSFQERREMNAHLSILTQARHEMAKLRQSPIGISLLAQIDHADEKTRGKIANFLNENAAALLALLHPSPDTPQARMDALFQSGGLVGLQQFAWEALGVGRDEARQLRAVTAAPARAEAWRSFLNARGERRNNSSRSNRIDGAAIACIEALNEQLEKLTQGRIRALLVTRVMTLLKSTSKVEDSRYPQLKTPGFLRHPRLTVLPGEMRTHTIDEPAARLSIALETFIQQLSAREERIGASDEPRRLLLDAWHGFEGARFTQDLREEVTQTPKNPRIEDTQFPKLLRWLANETDFERFIAEETDQTIRRFGRATFHLGKDKEADPIEARITTLGNPPRTSIRPLMTGVPGPVEFSAPGLRGRDNLYPDMEKILEPVARYPAEQYLAWALLHACRGRWTLAAIYARASADVAGVVSRSDKNNTANEARLLYAQVRRLEEVDPVHRTDAAVIRYNEVDRQLSLFRTSDGSNSGQNDPRVLHERAAQIIEFILIRGESLTPEVWLADGIGFAKQAVDRARETHDTLTEGRSLAMLLIYVLAVFRRNLRWPINCGDMLDVAAGWHRNLGLLLQRVPNHDELPRRTRAMEIVGHLILGPTSASLPSSLLRGMSPATRVPERLRNLAPELYDQLSTGHDQIASLISAELHHIVGPLRRHQQWDVVHAPIWAIYDAERILALIHDEEARGRARKAYEILKNAAGPRQHGVDAIHRRAYREANTELDEALKIVRETADAATTDGRFHLEMDWCYTQLLLALVNPQPSEARAGLQELRTRYESLTQRYPDAAIPHFRMHLVLEEIIKLEGEPSPSATRKSLQQDSRAQLDLAVAKAPSDPFLKDPKHWVFSTLKRRQAHQILQSALDFVEKPPNAAAVDRAILNLMEAARTSFPILYAGFDPAQFPEFDDFYRLERRRRINNIVFTGALYSGARGDLADLYDPKEITTADLLRYTQLLHTQDPTTDTNFEGIEKVPEIGIVHTIGYAYSVLGKPELAARAGDRLLLLIRDRAGELTADEHAVTLMNDALSWVRQNATAHPV